MSQCLLPNDWSVPWQSYRNGKPESSVICQYVCQSVLHGSSLVYLEHNFHSYMIAMVSSQIIIVFLFLSLEKTTCIACNLSFAFISLLEMGEKHFQ